MSEKRKRIKKIFSVVGTVLSVLIFVLAAFVLINVIVAKAKNKPVNFFGYAFANVLTNSMEPTIYSGDLIVYRLCDISEVAQDNIIVFVAGDGFRGIKGSNVVHRAVVLNDDGSITTKGDNIFTNPNNDIDPVTSQNFLGICVSSVAHGGEFFTFIINYGVIILIAVVALPFIVAQVVKIVRLAKNGDGEDKDEEKE